MEACDNFKPYSLRLRTANENSANADIPLRFHFKCNHCDKQYKTGESLRLHMAREHQIFLSTSSMIKPYTCGKCGKAFITKAALITHKLVHTNLRPFKCHICKASFKAKLHLNEHLTSKKHLYLVAQRKKAAACESQVLTPTSHNPVPNTATKSDSSVAPSNDKITIKIEVEDETPGTSNSPIQNISPNGYLRRRKAPQNIGINLTGLPHKCQHCSKSYPTKRKLYYHAYTKHSIKTFPSRPSTGAALQKEVCCTTCSEVFRSMPNLIAHKASKKHILTLVSPNQRVGNRSTSDISKLADGLLASTTGVVKPEQKDDQVGGFAKKLKVTPSKLTHKDTHTFECKICKIMFKEELYYNKHIERTTHQRLLKLILSKSISSTDILDKENKSPEANQNQTSENLSPSTVHSSESVNKPKPTVDTSAKGTKLHYSSPQPHLVRNEGGKTSNTSNLVPETVKPSQSGIPLGNANPFANISFNGMSNSPTTFHNNFGNSFCLPIPPHGSFPFMQYFPQQLPMMNLPPQFIQQYNGHQALLPEMVQNSQSMPPGLFQPGLSNAWNMFQTPSSFQANTGLYGSPEQLHSCSNCPAKFVNGNDLHIHNQSFHPTFYGSTSNLLLLY